MAKAEHLMMVGARDAAADASDFYETPEVAIEALLAVERFPLRIWEPACGAGAITRVLERKGHEVRSEDLYDHGMGNLPTDFFLRSRAPEGLDCIITNPPYSCATQFVDHACCLVEKSAFLLRLAFLEGQRRQQLFAQHRLSRVLVFSKRLPRMHRVGWTGPRSTSTIAFAWFVFNWDHVGNPQISWI